MTIKERLLKIHKLSQQIDELVDELVGLYTTLGENSPDNSERATEINIEIERLDDEIEILKLENKIENEMKLAKKGS